MSTPPSVTSARNEVRPVAPTLIELSKKAVARDARDRPREVFDEATP